MTMNDQVPEWADAEHLGGIAADELRRALDANGINYFAVALDSDGDVNIAFQFIADAETMVSLGVPAVHEKGTLYDRATGSCITLGELAASGTEPSEAAIRAAMKAGWTWTIHPYMQGRRMDWHASVDMPLADAYAVTANLNAVKP